VLRVFQVRRTFAECLSDLCQQSRSSNLKFAADLSNFMHLAVEIDGKTVQCLDIIIVILYSEARQLPSKCWHCMAWFLVIVPCLNTSKFICESYESYESYVFKLSGVKELVAKVAGQWLAARSRKLQRSFTPEEVPRPKGYHWGRSANLTISSATVHSFKLEHATESLDH